MDAEMLKAAINTKAAKDKLQAEADRLRSRNRDLEQFNATHIMDAQRYLADAEQLRTQLEQIEATKNNLTAIVTKRDAEITRLRTALGRYGNHRTSCPRHKNARCTELDTLDCTCGFLDALKPGAKS